MVQHVTQSWTQLKQLSSSSSSMFFKILASFLVLSGHWYALFGEMSRFSAHFFDWVVVLILSCVSCSYILGINPLLVKSLANIFSDFVGCLFIWFMVAFVVQKLLSLLRSYLFLFFPHYSRKQNQKNIAVMLGHILISFFHM